VKRWFIHYQTEPIIINWDSIKNDPESIDVVRDKANAYIEVMPVEDHDRIVAELRETIVQMARTQRQSAKTITKQKASD